MQLNHIFILKRPSSPGSKTSGVMYESLHSAPLPFFAFHVFEKKLENTFKNALF